MERNSVDGLPTNTRCTFSTNCGLSSRSRGRPPTQYGTFARTRTWICTWNLQRTARMYMDSSTMALPRSSGTSWVTAMQATCKHLRKSDILLCNSHGRFKNCAAGTVLDLYGWGHENGTAIKCCGGHGGTNQKWYLRCHSRAPERVDSLLRASPHIGMDFNHYVGNVLCVSDPLFEVQIIDDFDPCALAVTLPSLLVLSARSGPPRRSALAHGERTHMTVMTSRSR